MRKMTSAIAAAAVIGTLGIGGVAVAAAPTPGTPPADGTTVQNQVQEQQAQGRGYGPGAAQAAQGLRMGPSGTEAQAVADVLGMDAEDVRSALRAGTSLAELADQQGVELQTVVDAVVDAALERVTQLEDSGAISTDRAAQLEAVLPERIAEHLESGEPMQMRTGANGDGPQGVGPQGARGVGPQGEGGPGSCQDA
ncbi:hypothetical protein HJG43_13805 [Kineosporiaceae bacterium SCSIO 59966]|nr:hypothetical protein HJG43_13805 [Kineosporiaceae bacterium SCSIO 59966]